MDKEKWGLFIGGTLIKEYDEDQYSQAISDLNRAYLELGFHYELKKTNAQIDEEF